MEDARAGPLVGAEPTFGPTAAPTHVAAWMTVAEVRMALAAAGQPALPVVGHAELIGLITVEALATADAAVPVGEAMDWHLVQVPADADELDVVRRYTQAAWRWLDLHRRETCPPGGRTT